MWSDWRPSEEVLGTFAPIVVYWLYSGMYHILLGLPSLAKYRLHSVEDEKKKNLVTVPQVVRGVLLQQAVQVAVAFLLYTLTGSEENVSQPAMWVVAIQFVVAMVIMDGWQYACHRWMHQNKFMYKHVHSMHHRLVVPFAFGALYNHPLEGLLLDTVGGVISFLITGMTLKTSVFFFSFATIKTVDDHCGLWLPGNPLHMLFWNNTAYHDIHHQLHGTKYNFSQPFFISWDKICGTYMPYVIQKRVEGGLEARPLKKIE
jgi:sphinganine C4-monooxygenase